MIELILLGVIAIYHILGMTVVNEYILTIEDDELSAGNPVAPPNVRRFIAGTWPAHVVLSLFTKLGKSQGDE